LNRHVTRVSSALDHRNHADICRSLNSIQENSISSWYHINLSLRVLGFYSLHLQHRNLWKASEERSNRCDPSSNETIWDTGCTDHICLIALRLLFEGPSVEFSQSDREDEFDVTADDAAPYTSPSNTLADEKTTSISTPPSTTNPHHWSYELLLPTRCRKQHPQPASPPAAVDPLSAMSYMWSGGYLRLFPTPCTLQPTMTLPRRQLASWTATEAASNVIDAQAGLQPSRSGQIQALNFSLPAIQYIDILASAQAIISQTKEFED